MANNTLPANAEVCRSGGRCGDTTGYHIRGSAAHTKCTFIADNMSSASGSLDRIAAAPKSAATNKEGRKPLRAMTDEESEMLEAARSAAYTMMPFYSHLLYKMNVVAADEEPTIVDGEPSWQMRAGVNKDWRLIVNFDWMRHEINKAKAKYEAELGSEAGAEAGRWVAAVQMGKVLLHEVGHVMYDSWSLPEQLNLDHRTLNIAEDAVINGPLRQLGHAGGVVPNENIHGEFMENAVYGGSIECDDPNHSWEHTDKDGKKTRRCSYDQTTMHYYQRLTQKQQEQEESQESGGGNDSDEQESHAYDQEADGDKKGQPGGGSKETPQGGQQSSDDSDDGEGSGDENQQTSGKGNAGGEGAPGSESGSDAPGGGGSDPGETCGRSAAEKYEDDDFGKNKMSEDAKRVSLDMTANAIEDWVEDNAERAEGMGLGSGSMARKWAESRKMPDNVKWDGLIKNVVQRSILSKKRKRSTYSKPNRRSTAMGTIRRGQKDGYMPSIANAIDTSGSMSSEDLFMAYNSVSNVIKRTGARDVHAFAVDSTAQTKPVKIKSAEDLAPLLTGGMGTDMQVGIRAAAKAGHDVCIVYTDGMTPWNDMQMRKSDPDVGNMDVIVAVIADNESAGKRWADDVPAWMTTVIISKESLKNARDSKDQPDTVYWG